MSSLRALLLMRSSTLQIDRHPLGCQDDEMCDDQSKAFNGEAIGSEADNVSIFIFVDKAVEGDLRLQRR